MFKQKTRPTLFPEINNITGQSDLNETIHIGSMLNQLMDVES